MSTTVIRFEHRVDDVLTDVTGVVLSDPTGTFGVKRNDTGVTVVADGVALEKQSTGVYTYSFTDPAISLTYTYWLEWVYEGETQQQEFTIASGNGDTPTAAEMVTLLKKALRDHPIGIVSVTVDGQTVNYTRKQALDELRYWQREAAQENDERPRLASIKFY